MSYLILVYLACAPDTAARIGIGTSLKLGSGCLASLFPPSILHNEKLQGAAGT